MKPAGKRQKGRRLELKLAQMIREKNLDKKASRMPLSGALPHLQGDIYSNLAIHFECKNQERLRIWEWWQKIRCKRNPCLVISANFRPILAVVDIEFLLNLLKVEKEYLEDIDGRK